MLGFSTNVSNTTSSCGIALGACACITRSGDFSVGSTTAQILTAATGAGSLTSAFTQSAACWMCIRVNGTAYKIPLYT
jgi:hypothetical protein